MKTIEHYGMEYLFVFYHSLFTTSRIFRHNCEVLRAINLESESLQSSRGQSWTVLRALRKAWGSMALR